MAWRKTLEAEIAALQALEQAIDGDMQRAAGLVRQCVGKLIVTGMGKAGLIGQKISATFRSTGTPSAFLDPAQALHGDMGMINAPIDCILAISNSGQTDEVLAVMEYARLRDVSVIAITGDKGSPIAATADIAITYPRGPEGCPFNRAPMASAISMLAIGDAMAAELMHKKGFTERDFLALHHGGYLGQQIRERVAQTESN